MNKEKTIFMQQRFIFVHTNMVALLMLIEIAFTTHVWVQLLSLIHISEPTRPY